MRLQQVTYVFNDRKGKHKASLFNLQLVNEMEHKMFQDIQQSLKSSDQIDKVHQIATTHSNLCAVYSQMGQH